jgi:hypothetical protein
VPISGGIPPSITPAMAEDYANSVLNSVVAQSEDFEDVILIDIYGTGASKVEYKTLLMACEPYTKAPKGSFSKISQIAIVDAITPNPKPVSQVPFVDNGIVVVSEKGLTIGLTNGEYPRIIPNYPTTVFTKNPATLIAEDNLNTMGRLEVLKALQE